MSTLSASKATASSRLFARTSTFFMLAALTIAICAVRVYLLSPYQLDVAPYDGQAYIELSSSLSSFTDKDFSQENTEEYYPIDYLARATGVYAVFSSVNKTTADETISYLFPSGWTQAKYPSVIGGDGFLYTRSRLISALFSLQPSDCLGVITLTVSASSALDSFNAQIKTYLAKNNSAVVYRARPVYAGDSLLPVGLHLEAASCKDQGKALSINVYIYNEQSGIVINHVDGSSHLPHGDYFDLSWWRQKFSSWFPQNNSTS